MNSTLSKFLVLVTLTASITAQAEADFEKHNKAIWDLQGKSCGQSQLLKNSLPSAMAVEKNIELLISNYTSVYNSIMSQPILAEGNVAGQNLISDRIVTFTERLNEKPASALADSVKESETKCLPTSSLANLGWTYFRNSSRFGLYGFRSGNFKPEFLEDYDLIQDAQGRDLKIYLTNINNNTFNRAALLQNDVLLLEKNVQTEETRKDTLIKLNFCVDIQIQRNCGLYDFPELYLDISKYNEIIEKTRTESIKTKNIATTLKAIIISKEAEFNRISSLLVEIPQQNHEVSIQLAPALFKAGCKYEIPYHEIGKRLNREFTYGMGHLCPSQWKRDH